jgi:ABC-type nitrate/sulfonate/bicarbonate transport system substrate-binding protein
MRLLPVAILLLALLPGCRRTRPDRPGPLQAVRVAYTTQPQSTLVHLAVAKGYFRAEGLEVASLVHTFGKAALQSVLDGRADFATVAETPIMFNVLKGAPIRVIANIEASTLNNAIVARRDAGIAAPADLKGKRIAFTPGSTSEFFLDALLTTAGRTRQDVRPVPMKPDDMEEAVLAGRIDAACTWNYPLARIRRRLGANGILILDREIYTETFNIAVLEPYLAGNPDTVRRFLRALVRAEAFAARQPEEAQAIVAAATGTAPDLVREVWSAFAYRVALDQTLLITLEDETRWAMRNGLTDQTVMPDYRRNLHAESLRAVRQEASKAAR